MNKEKVNIAIFGANGSIGRALCRHYQKESHVYAFSRKNFDSDDTGLNKILLNDYEEETLSEAASGYEDDFFNTIIISIGMLHNHEFMPEKRIEDFSSDQFLETIKINTLIPTLILSLIHI